VVVGVVVDVVVRVVVDVVVGVVVGVVVDVVAGGASQTPQASWHLARSSLLWSSEYPRK